MTNETHRFQVNLRGIIALLSNNLYSGPAVFVRELLQNSVDAMHARALFEPAFASPRIEFSLVESRGNPPTLLIEDNGIGLTEEEVHRFLATIGESSKRDELGAARQDFIGQFGIGLLSCFMVADEIVMVTRSAKPDSAAVEWRGRPDGTYGVRRLESKGSAGTRVFLRCKAGAEEYFGRERLRELIVHYGGLLTVPVWLTAPGGVPVHVNEQQPPWRSNGVPSREELLEYGQTTLKSEFFDAIPLHSEAGAVDGVAYILPASPSPSARQKHRLYLKNMLVSEQAQGLLPEWAFFVRCVLNSDLLRPTASREGFYEDDALQQTREELGECLRRWLLRLARHEPERLQRFIAIHYLAIKSLALHDDEFYRLFIDMLPFETSRGHLTLREYRADNPKILYAETVDQFRQIAAVAAAQNICVINAGYTYDRDLLERFAEFFPDTTVERVDAESLAQAFDDLSPEEREECFELQRIADIALQRFRCGADVRKFKPDSLVALYNISDNGLLFRSAKNASDQANDDLAGILSGALGDGGHSPYAQLCFNYRSPLVRRLTQLSDRKLLTSLAELVYVQALLAGHHPLAAKEMKLLNDGLLNLITLAAGETKGEAK